jgi:hypothetical protein
MLLYCLRGSAEGNFRMASDRGIGGSFEAETSTKEKIR